MLEDFEEGYDVDAFIRRRREGEVFDGGGEVGEFWRGEGRVAALVRLRDRDEGGGGVEGGYG